MSVYDFTSTLFCNDIRKTEHADTASFVHHLTSSLMRRWPKIKPEPMPHPVRPGHAYLSYRSNEQVIEIELSGSPKITGHEDAAVFVRFYIENPPEVRETFLQIIEWLMDTYAMECSPGWALSDSPSERCVDDGPYTSFEEVLPVLNRFIDVTWRFWEDHPELLQERLQSLAPRKQNV